jgi:4-amino-4-deoxy-L-arabinose transferase-like glycosyltransferase
MIIGEKERRPARRLNQVLLALILCLGFALRMLQPTLVEFKRDEATVVRAAQAIAFEGSLPAVGIDSSQGIDNLPLTNYLAALPLLVWSDPVAVVVFTALLNALALVACYFMVRGMFGERIALLSTLLFAVSPWAVLYARKIWPRTMPLFTIALIAALYWVVVRRRYWALAPACLALAALLGLQLEALAFVPLMGVVLLLYRDTLRWRPVLAGALIGTLALAPYVLHDSRNGWDNLRGLAAYAGGESILSLDAVRYAFMLIGSKGIEGQAGSLFPAFRAAVPPLWWLNDLLAVLLVAALGYALHQAFLAPAEARRRTFGLLLLWFAVPIALQLKASSPTQLHYFVMHYPVQYILIAVLLVEGVDRLRAVLGAARGTPWIAGALAGMLILGCGWQVLVTAQLREYMAAHPSTGGYGIPLRYSRQAAQAAVRLAGSGEVVVLGPETRPFMTETPTVFAALLFGTLHRFADVQRTLLFPERTRVVYLSGPVTETAPASGTMALLRLRTFPSTSQGPELRLADGVRYHNLLWQSADRGEVLAGMDVWPAGRPFANNVVFAAHEMAPEARVGRELVIWLAWWIRAEPGPGEYHFTVQMLDETGRLRSQDDQAGFPAATWQTGDLVLSRFALPLSDDITPGVYQVRAGMYTYPEIEAVSVLDSVGQAIDDGVTLGEVRIVE